MNESVSHDLLLIVAAILFIVFALGIGTTQTQNQGSVENGQNGTSEEQQQ